MSLGNKLKEFWRARQLTISKKIALTYGIMFFFILAILNYLSYWGIERIIEIDDSASSEYFIQRVFIVMTIIGFVVAVDIGYLISRKMLGRVKEITSTAKSISEKDLNQRMELSGPHDELRDLKVTLNNMIARLEEAFNKQKRFVSDASHELRTPLTVIQGYTEMLKRWGKNDEAILEESIEAIHQETLEMQKLIEKLLLLARYDAEQLKLEAKSVNLTEIIDELIKESKILHPYHKVLKNIPEEEVYVIGDEHLIKQLLRIPLDNAYKYTGEYDTITISMNYEEGVIIKIKDTGPGISKEDLPHLLERFYRADKSRTKETGGHGLGLNIAQAIIEAHGGSISIESTLGNGTTVTLNF